MPRIANLFVKSVKSRTACVKRFHDISKTHQRNPSYNRQQRLLLKRDFRVVFPVTRFFHLARTGSSSRIYLPINPRIRQRRRVGVPERESTGRAWLRPAENQRRDPPSNVAMLCYPTLHVATLFSRDLDLAVVISNPCQTSPLRRATFLPFNSGSSLPSMMLV